MRGKAKTSAVDPAGEISLLKDHARFDEFYRKYFLPLVRRSTWKRGLDKEDARDVVQEAFIVALAKLDPQRNPKAWLIQVVDHLSLNLRRKIVRRLRLTSRWSREEGGHTSSDGSTERPEAYDESDDYAGGDD